MQGSGHLRKLPLTRERDLSNMVEHQTNFTLEGCELAVFETHQQAEEVNLAFNNLVLTSMIRGKKVMRLFGEPGFDYLPGESVLAPAGELMRIDFPDAAPDNPAQCIALSLCADTIQRVTDLLNERYPRSAQTSWEIDCKYFHLENNPHLTGCIDRLVYVCMEEHSREKDVIAGFALQELLVRLMQTQARALLQNEYAALSSRNPMAAVVEYIRDNITQALDIDALAKKACMSRANFYRSFKQELGVTPNQFIQQERLRLARQYLRDRFYTVTQVCYMTGFNDLNHFIRTFKRHTGRTPKAFQNEYIA